MKCPVCKAELIVGGRQRLETLSEHVFNPNGEPSLKNAYICPSFSCPCNYGQIRDDKPIPKVFWNEEGELYATHYADSNDIPFINNNDAPFGSFQRKCNVEIYKKDENKLLFTIRCWPLKGWKVKSHYSYRSNEDGDILKRRFHLEWITNGGSIHIWGYRMLIFCLKRTWSDWKDARKNPGVKYYQGHLEDSIKQALWPRAEWWRKINAKVATLALKYS